jgi:hypothetical protein
VPNYFRDNSQRISLRPLTIPNSGFRPGQLGALHAVLSHFSVFEEPAIVSLPTGYGKTAVIMALPYILEANRLLVVEPSDALRRQTSCPERLRGCPLVLDASLANAGISSEIYEMERMAAAQFVWMVHSNR